MSAIEAAANFLARTFDDEDEAIECLARAFEDYARQHANVLAEKLVRVHAELDETQRALALLRRSS